LLSGGGYTDGVESDLVMAQMSSCPVARELQLGRLRPTWGQGPARLKGRTQNPRILGPLLWLFADSADYREFRDCKRSLSVVNLGYLDTFSNQGPGKVVRTTVTCGYAEQRDRRTG
jgi:hypothetical protein